MQSSQNKGFQSKNFRPPLQILHEEDSQLIRHFKNLFRDVFFYTILY